jgi:hypothetical protein
MKIYAGLGGSQVAGSKTALDGPSAKFVRTSRRYRTIHIRAGDHTITAADPLPDDLVLRLTASTDAPPAARIGPTRVEAGTR